MIVETAQFNLKPGVNDEQFLAESQKTNDDYLAKCKGYVSRELLKSDDGVWLDIVRFETLHDAENAAKGFQGNPATKSFEDCIDPSTAKMVHYTLMKKYSSVDLGAASK